MTTTQEIADLLGTDPAGITQAIGDLISALEEEVGRREQLERELTICRSALYQATADAATGRAQNVELVRRINALRLATQERGRTNTKTRKRI